ncbi:hypothetical protein BX661DRAFT_17837 [Kickxella alabastrina]|uniref:uncharacterized protein n=1 Tax=Kickxella alabastrina TaxID=61397 RepID=UPI002220A1D1|nr:uncharacterized protein BX661DRAFT_17837 [Kickxella alabastrina]KAI7827815.1 hypothetical protein BX661DRAFT_17837 [Kickxella alabastrina]
MRRAQSCGHVRQQQHTAPNTSLESVQRPASAFDQSVDSLPNMSEDPKRIIAQMKKLNRQRSETAPLRPVQKHDHSPDQHQSQNQLHQLHLQIQRGPSSPRKEKTHKHEGLSAKLGAFFNKLTLDAETSPRLKSTKGLAFTPVNSPRTPGFPAHQLGASAASVAFPKYPGTMGFQKPASTCGAANDAAKRSNERSLSDAPKSPQISRISAAVKTEPRLTHRVTVSHCQAPALGIAPRQHQQLLRLEQDTCARHPRAASCRASVALTRLPQRGTRRRTRYALALDQALARTRPRLRGRPTYRRRHRRRRHWRRASVASRISGCQWS